MAYGKDAFIAEFEADGFITRTRNMDFRATDAKRTLEKIRYLPSHDLSVDDAIEVIELLWSVPYYALRYKKGCVEMGASSDDYDRVVRELQTVTRETMKILLAQLRSRAG